MKTLMLSGIIKAEPGKTKIMFHTQLNRIKSLYGRVKPVVCAVVLIVLIGGAAIAHADQYDTQINALQQQNNAAQGQLNNLAAQASSYQDAINQLQGQINALQSAIATNQSKQTDLQNQIAADQQDIATKKAQLADDIKTMYIDGQMTAIEELASSSDLSQYIDKEEYRTQVQNELNSKIAAITQLEEQLQQQKQQLEIVIKTEQQQNAQLAASQSQQQQLLAYNQSQQDSFNQQIQNNQAQIASLRAQQAAANRRLLGNGSIQYSGSCGGGYPGSAAGPFGNWGCDYAKDNTYDNWGMGNRECVSYTAWMVYKTYGYMPYWGGYGNANQWPADARAAGIPTGSTPKVGSVAIAMIGYYGHAMWVTGVSGDYITVQQYNYDLAGDYSTMTINGAGLTYIYFGG